MKSYAIEISDPKYRRSLAADAERAAKNASGAMFFFKLLDGVNRAEKVLSICTWGEIYNELSKVLDPTRTLGRAEDVINLHRAASNLVGIPDFTLLVTYYASPNVAEWLNAAHEDPSKQQGLSKGFGLAKKVAARIDEKCCCPYEPHPH